MSLLRKLRIGHRLMLAFAALLGLLVFVAGFGVAQLARINDNVQDLNTNWLPSVAMLAEMQGAANAARQFSLRSALAADDEVRQAASRQHDAALKRFDEAANAYEPSISGPVEQGLYAAIQDAWRDYRAADTELQSVIDAGEDHHAQARTLSAGRSAALFDKLSEAINKDVSFNRQGGDEAAGQAAASYTSGLRVSGLAVAAAVVVGLLLAVQVTRSITVPLAEAALASVEVANGNLTLEIRPDGQDEAADLLRSMARMVEQLGSLVGQVRSSSENIANGSQEIAQGNADLSQRTESQAGSLQETAASMEQLTGSVAHNAASAAEANRMASEAAGAAAEGGEAVGTLVSTMRDISESSTRIGNIIGVIDSIAFQTNILALNAAVEAARAGEQGRGFVVVASEVRSLAQRSAAAAKEIKDLIQASAVRVEAGARQARGAGDVMLRVVAQVGQVSALIRDISSSSQEQNDGIQQVGSAVSHLDEVTQQNAALVEESAAAAESLNQQAQQLAQLVSRFRVRG